MDDAELSILLNDLESDRVERKESCSDPTKIRQAICAFANDLANHNEPGVVFLGVKDNGECANLAISDRLLLTLSGMRSDGNILPIPTMTVEKRVLSGCELAVVIVQPSLAPPVRFKGQTWIRVGPRRATASREEERRLNEKRRFKDLPFDLLPFESASVEDLNIQLFQQVYLSAALSPEVLDENNRSVEQQLTSLRFLSAEVASSPTMVGLLSVGKDPRQFFPGAYVQFVRFEGTDLTDPIKDQKDIGGPLIDMLRFLDEILLANISIASDITAQPVEVNAPDYPIVALQQLVRNAIMHRSYEQTNAPVRVYWFSDRVEIQNPGSLYGQVNRENFGVGVTDYRNPHLAEVMKTLGYVQRFGIGIPTTKKQLEKNGNPPPEFIIEDSYFAAIVRQSLQVVQT